jgi:hypothetical protein
MVPDEVLRGDAGTVTHRGKIGLVPLANLACSNEIDQFLQPVLKAGRKEVHAAIENILEAWPGRSRAELWTRLRQLRYHRSKASNGRIDWDQEDIEILRTQYGHGRAGAREAIKKILARRPGRSARSIWHKAATLGVSNGSGKPRPWSREEQGILLWNVGEKPVEKIARKLARTVKAVRQMMSSRGLSSKVRIPKDYSLHRVARLLGVSDSVVRVWFRKGLFGESANPGRQRDGSRSGPRVSAAALAAFCRKHPDKVNTRQCHPDLWLVMGDESVPPNAWYGPRQHLTKKRRCPGCQRVVRGNAYFRHVKRCISRGTSARGTGSRTTTTG